MIEVVKQSKAERDLVIDAAIADAVSCNQLPQRVEREDNGTIRIFFTWGSVFVGIWDHSGDKSQYVGRWINRPKYDA